MQELQQGHGPQARSHKLSSGANSPPTGTARGVHSVWDTVGRWDADTTTDASPSLSMRLPCPSEQGLRRALDIWDWFAADLQAKGQAVNLSPLTAVRAVA